jgi:hypothetical protein
MPLITSAILGVLAPELTKLLNSGISWFTAGAEHKRKIELLKLAHNNEIDLAHLKVFEKAQMDLSSGMTYPPGATSWQTWLVLAVNASIHIIRPFLTAGALAMLATMAFFPELQSHPLAEEVVFTCVAIIRYWFGYREETRKLR